MSRCFSDYHKEVIYARSKDGKSLMIEKFPYTDDEMKQKLQRQISDLPLLRACNFLPIIEIKSEPTHLEIHYEKFDYGSLEYFFGEVRKKRKYLSEKAISIIIISILKPMNALHLNNYIHRNIYPCNIYIKSNGEIALGGLHLIIRVNELGNTMRLTASEISRSDDFINLGLIIFRLITNNQCESKLPENAYQFENEVPRHLKSSLLINFMMRCFGSKDETNLLDDEFISHALILYRDSVVIQHGDIDDSMFSDEDSNNIQLIKKNDEIKVLKELGRGGYGTVYHVVIGNLHLAKKSISQGNFVHREIEFCRKLIHDNIVNTFLPLCTQNPDTIPFLIYTELCKTSLTAFLNHIFHRKQYPSKFFIMKVICSLIDALCWIHKIGLVHRDVKPDNVLITFGGTIVLCDLGCIGIVDENHLRQTLIGSPHYMAGEVNGRELYDQSVDIFSLGCLFYLLCKWEHPPERNALLGNVSIPWKPIHHYERYQFMKEITDLMRSDREDRISMEKLLDHPAIKRYNSTTREMPVYINGEINPFMILNNTLLLPQYKVFNKDHCILHCFESPKLTFPSLKYTILNFPTKLNDDFIGDLSFIFPRVNFEHDLLFQRLGIEKFSHEIIQLILKFIPLIGFKITKQKSKTIVILDDSRGFQWDWGSNLEVLEAIDNIFSILRFIVDNKPDINQPNQYNLADILITGLFKSLILLSYSNQHKFLYCELIAKKWFSTVTNDETSPDKERFIRDFKAPELTKLLNE